MAHPQRIKGCRARHSGGGKCDDKRRSHPGEPHHYATIGSVKRWWEVECDEDGSTDPGSNHGRDRS